MEKDFNISWSELLWDGITVKGGYRVTGQLLRRGKDEYYICTNTYYMYRENERMAPMIGRWHKVIPSTIKRVVFIEITEEEEEEIKQNFFTQPIPEHMKNINFDDIEFDGYFTLDECESSK